MSRKKSEIINIRLFHNWIKQSLIKESVDYLKKNYQISDIQLLDLAVGRGGDMHKWYLNGVYNVVGVDIDKESIYGKNGAIHRYKKLVGRLKSQNKRVPKYRFYTADLSDPKSITLMKKFAKPKSFDIVSCQFAIHYFFKNQTSLETFIKIVGDHIAEKGIFIGTTMDGDKLKKIFDKTDMMENNLFSLAIINKKNGAFGNEYKVSLGKREGEEHYFAKRDSIEYMVHMDTLIKECEKYGLKFIGKTDFDEWYVNYIKENPDKELSGLEKEFSFLNFSFVFMKI